MRGEAELSSNTTTKQRKREGLEFGSSALVPFLAYSESAITVESVEVEDSCFSQAYCVEEALCTISDRRTMRASLVVTAPRNSFESRTRKLGLNSLYENSFRG